MCELRKRNYAGGGHRGDGSRRSDGQGLPRGLLHLRGVRNAADGRTGQALLSVRGSVDVPIVPHPEDYPARNATRRSRRWTDRRRAGLGHVPVHGIKGTVRAGRTYARVGKKTILGVTLKK
uniref:(northern house mosquito) hypothetical protein n=1 Tax=Culex pipiens TaxID=7175 RepID=A0A8D8F337_CULPI